MKFLFVAPRYHPNQVPIIEGLIDSGNEVMFCVSRSNESENHGRATVKVLRPSIVSVIDSKLKKKKNINMEDYMISAFVPNLWDVLSSLIKYKPDVIILREKYRMTFLFYVFSRILIRCKRILYTQMPLYIKEDDSFPKNLIEKAMSLTTMTTCMYEEYPDDKLTYKKRDNTYFIPFVIRKNRKVRKARNIEIVRIFDSGKYRPYKNHLLLIEAAYGVIQAGYKNFTIDIVGQCITDDEKKYFMLMKKKIAEYHLEKIVHLREEITYSEMEEEFLHSDIYILPSDHERANISILDAMSFGVPVIATKSNGTSSYIKDGETGYVFNNNNVDDLKEKMLVYLKNTELINFHGENAYKMCSENYNFEKYYQSIKKIINE